ncbi:MAG: hypothetical protein FWD04_11545 [Conexibacteraceae bacterium]|nr:hypothetical protein [Conexibacteraceae bacterium]
MIHPQPTSVLLLLQSESARVPPPNRRSWSVLRALLARRPRRPALESLPAACRGARPRRYTINLIGRR